MTIGNVIKHLSNLNDALSNQNLFDTFRYSKSVFENLSGKDIRQRNIANIYSKAPIKSGFRALNSFGFYRLSSEPIVAVSYDLSGNKYPVIRCNCLYRKGKNFDVEAHEYNVSPLVNISALGFDFSDLQKPTIINHHTLPSFESSIFNAVEEGFFSHYPEFRKKLAYIRTLVGKTIYVAKQAPTPLLSGGIQQVTFWCIFPSSFFFWTQSIDKEIPYPHNEKIAPLFEFLQSQ